MSITRRNFLAASALSAGLMGLAGCSTASDTTAAPAADTYPIDPDDDDVEAKWSSEETRDGWTKVTQDGGATLGVMDTAKIIQVDGYAFRDMNGDGKLELWEDWRQSDDDRARALAESLEAENLYSLVFAGGTQSSQVTTDTESMDYIEQGSRSGVSRLQTTLDTYGSDVAWINTVQETCEKSELGIPYLNYCDPSPFFDVPDAVGLAAAMDKDLWRKAGMWQARAWRAAGVRCELGPQVDVYSNPIGVRLAGSVSEDPALNRDFAQAYGGGMQSTWGDDDATDDQGWGDQSCAVMLKHYVGEGCPEGGRNDHQDSGKWNVFPGSNFNAHLVPFLDGGMHLDSKTEQVAAIMPCYGIAYDPNDPDGLGEHVGSSYSTHNISILRNAGWDGLITTDWMILENADHGVKDLTVEERMAKLMENSIDQHGGTFQPDVAESAYNMIVEEKSEDEALSIYREHARRTFKVMAELDLFDQPYSERSACKEILENETAAAFGKEANEKCVVMMKNSGNVISQDGIKGKVYVPQVLSSGMGMMMPGMAPTASVGYSIGDEETLASYFDEVVTDTVADTFTGDPDDSGNPTPTEADITRLTAEDLADVKYAVIRIQNPQDAYGGVTGGPQFFTMPGASTEVEPAVYYPITLQYRPFTADGDYVRKESLNPEDEFGEYENRSVYGQSTYATNESDLDLVLDIKSKLPEDAKLILIVAASNPMVFSEIEPSADVILMGWGMGMNGLSDDAYLSVIAGKVEPSGLSPFQMPANMETVFTQDEDVPRDMECYTDSDGNTYDFCFGLNWSGVIDDDRTATYKASPLTQPETEVKADE